MQHPSRPYLALAKCIGVIDPEGPEKDWSEGGATFWSCNFDNNEADFFIDSRNFYCTISCNYFWYFSFYTGEYPEAWSKGIIVPIHKKGDIDNPSNYRGEQVKKK